MNQTETEASADTLLDVVEQLVRDTRQGRTVRAALDSSLERDLGLDSLARVELVLRVERACSVSLPERALYTAETPRDLLRLIHGSQGVRSLEPEKGIRSLVQAEPGALACAAETLLDALDWHVERHPDRLQVHLYAENGEEELSYAAIRRGAAGCASRLAGHGMQPGQTVAIMLPTGRDYLFSWRGEFRCRCILRRGRRRSKITCGATSASSATVAPQCSSPSRKRKPWRCCCAPKWNRCSRC